MKGNESGATLPELDNLFRDGHIDASKSLDNLFEIGTTTLKLFEGLATPSGP